jgi:predicted nucleic acid-binding protein
MDLIADTTLLVGLWRKQPWAQSFASRNADQSIGLPWVVLGEFWHGAEKAKHDPERVRQFLHIGLPILNAEPVIPFYARLCSSLQDQPSYKLVGQNDLWIAATALALQKPLITRNRRHFDKIKGLRFQALLDE